MNQDNRVLAREGARELTPNEAESVMGGLNPQFTICSFHPPGGDGDCR